MPAPTEKISVARKVVRAACPHDCPDTCAMQITVENGVAVKVEGAKDHPFTAGTLCTKVARYLERTYSKDRVLFPRKRVGTKGRGEFERISWDEYDYAGTMGYVQWHSMGRRFFNRLGASRLDRTICSSAGKEGVKITVGGSFGMDPERFDEAKLVLIWGSNPIVSNLHLWSRVQEAKRRGAKLVAIDPYRSLSAEKCHEHLAPLPGTDAALALGLMHVIIGEGRHDADYVEKYTIGFEALTERVKDYPPGKVAEITGLPAEKIIALAREYAATRPAAIRLNYGLQRHAGGGMAVRNILCLPALTGDWRHPAGGAVLSTSGFFDMNDAKIERLDLLQKSKCPNPRTINMVAIGDALLEAKPPIRALYVYNSNPVAVAPDSGKVVKGFSREDLFTVVHAIAPLGESLPNSEAFRRLAARMGFAEECFRDSDEDICRQAVESPNPRMQGIEWESLKAKGWQRLNVPERFAPFARGNFGTPSGKCEFYSETAKSMGMDPLPTYIPPRESARSNPALASRYPLAIISPPNRHFLNSSFANMPFAIAEAKEPSLEIHPADAAARSIRDGDSVRIFNDRGSLAARARVSDSAREGVVVALSVWWRKLTADRRNANELTAQALTDIGRGATFYDCLVDVRRTAHRESASADPGLPAS